MKLFWQDHRSLIVMNAIQLLLVLTVIQLDASDVTAASLGYAFFLSAVILFVFLIYRYLRRKDYYKQLSAERPVTRHDFQLPGDQPLIMAHNRLLKQFYQLYQYDLQRLESRKNQHVHFMNQWVHQMKTPLAVLDMMMEDEAEYHDVEPVRHELDRLRKGLNVALYAARLDQFEEDFRIKDVLVLPIVQQVIQDNKRMFVQKELYPKLHIDAEERVITDPKWFAFIIEQLVINSAKYSKRGMTITIKFEDDCLEVIDQGMGIPRNDLPLVCRAFYTGENGRITGESTGMGLYLVAQISEKLGLSLSIDSDVGKGTKISLFHQEGQKI